MAFPHHAIAQPGSTSSAASKASIAAGNQNECSSVTPRSTSGRAAAAQLVGNETVPTEVEAGPWPAWPACCADDHEGASNRNNTALKMAPRMAEQDTAA